MSAVPLNLAAAEVLKHYSPLLSSGLPQPLGNRGGFSGARLWRIDGPVGSLCLRAWPAGFPAERLLFIHLCMNVAWDAGLSFVPRLFAPDCGKTWVERGGRLWELQEWLPGEANYHRRPSLAKRQAACAALARLHTVWQSSDRFDSGPYPAVKRRLEAVREWRELMRSGWRPLAQAAPDDPARLTAVRAWQILSPRIDAVPALLKRWNTRIGPLQSCLCDIWHDHVLFDGDRLTGVVDYGAMKIDHPAADVARLLGSLVEDDPAGWATGLAAYRQVRPFTAEEEDLAHALDRTGALMGIATWLRRLYHGEADFTDRQAAARRLEELINRIEKQPAGL